MSTSHRRDLPGEQEDQGPPPRRRRWLVWLVVVVVLLAIPAVLCILWTSANRAAEADLAAAVAAIRARNEPLDWSELAPAPIPPDRNAALVYRQAFGAILAHDKADAAAAQEAKRLGDLLDHLLADAALRRKQQDDVRAILAASAEALKLARQARGLPGVDWQVDYAGPAVAVRLPHLANSRNLARLLALAAVHAHESGDDAEAVEYLRDLHALARAVRRPPTLITYLVGIVIGCCAHDALERIAPRLAVGETKGQAPGRAARSLLADLLDEPPFAADFRKVWVAERSFAHDTCQRLARGEMSLTQLGGSAPTPVERFFGGLARPRVVRDHAWMLNFLNGTIAAAEKPTFPAAMAALPALPAHDSTWARKHPIAACLLPSSERSFAVHFEVLAFRRMAAVALAMRLFEVDRGRRPAKLADLVNEYIPAVPDDPFAAQPSPIRYVPDPAEPLLYSVNQDGIDDAGRYKLVQSSGTVDLEALDLVFFLNGTRPEATQQTTRPAATRPSVGGAADPEPIAPGAGGR